MRQRYSDFMPTGAGALFLIQIVATLSYSVLYSTLILYATNGLHLSDMYATSLTGSFIALNYFLHLLGGFLGGRYFSYRSLFCIAMFLQVLGCVLISIPTESSLLWGLASFLGGSGINVTCINCMVTQLFEPHDKRREAAFLWNYSGMNIGFFVGFAIGGYFHLQGNYRELFLLSGLGNLLAMTITLYNWKILKDRDTTFMEAASSVQKNARFIGIGIIVALVFALRFLMEHTDFCNNLIIVIGSSMLVVLGMLSFRQHSSGARRKIWAYMILAVSSVTFWALYQLAPMGLNLFIDRNVDRHVFGILVAPQWIQNINTVVIILGGPILSVVFSRMREKGKNISIPLQFSVALLLIGIAFAILPLGISLADPQGYVAFGWIFACYMLQSLGELFISPIGYAMVGELAPVKLRGLMMGMWLMITGVAATLSDYFSKIALGTVKSSSPLVTNPSFSHTFGVLGWSAIGVSVLLFACIPLVSRLTHEKKSDEPKNFLELSEEAAG